MASKGPGLRWGVEQRLEFIEFCLFWEGGVNRADITGFFGVSVPQASKDLSQYQELAPENVRYDRSEKRYFATDSFKPRFLEPDADQYLAQLTSLVDSSFPGGHGWLTNPPSVDAMPVPHRRVDVSVLREILAAIRAPNLDADVAILHLGILSDYFLLILSQFRIWRENYFKKIIPLVVPLSRLARLPLPPNIQDT